MGPRKSVLLAAAGVVLAVVSVSAYLIMRSADKHGVAARPRTSHSAQALTAAQANGLASSLRSGSASRVSAVVALPAGKSVSSAFVAQLHALKGLRIDAATSRDDGDGTGTAVALVIKAAGSVSTWTILLVRGPTGAWKVTATAPARGVP
jgi:hypothetical protein